MKRPFIAVMAFALGASVTACAALKTNATQATELTCAGATAAINVLAPLAASQKISAADASAISESVEVITPICTQPTAPTLDSDRITVLNSAANTLAALAAKYQETSK